MPRPLRSATLLLLITIDLVTVRAALITHDQNLTQRLEQIYEKLENLSVNRLSEKIDRYNRIGLDDDLTADEEEVLSAMQEQGLSGDDLGWMAKEMRRVKMEDDGEKLDTEYPDDAWNEEDLQYYGDADGDWEGDEDIFTDLDGSTTKPSLLSVTPAAIMRIDSMVRRHHTSDLDPVIATNERPRILDDSGLTSSERSALRRSAVASMRAVVQAGRCLTPQPRWLSVRALAPAADIVYMPPCVQLHRCAPDSGCCYSEADVCAPVEGKHVVLPFYLHRANGSNSAARLMFYNHTRCACIPREMLKMSSRVESPKDPPLSREGISQPDRKERLALHAAVDVNREVRDMQEWQEPTEEPRLDDESNSTTPPQMVRCTCPTLFRAKVLNSDSCVCTCNWPDYSRRRDCFSLSRGKEHFGIRDRVCIASGDCRLPTCDYGPYMRTSGRCPLGKMRRSRRHGGRKNLDKIGL